jgi:hypothetical protein
VLGKQKKWYLPKGGEPLQVDGELVRALGDEDVYKYLGIQFSGTGRARAEVQRELAQVLSNITRAPLKPQQRLYCLKHHAVPRLMHRLVLSKTTLNALKVLDRLIRRSVRLWTTLPGDTPLGCYYAKAADGGMGIPCLRSFVPRVSKARRDNLRTLEDPDIQALISSDTWVRRDRTALSTTLGETNLETSQKETLYWKEHLYNTLDGRGMANFSETPSASNWVMRGNALMKGYGFIRALKIRTGTWYTRARASRGRMRAAPMCDAGCNAREALSHIVQSCSRTHVERVKRHDRITALLRNRLRPQCLVEPTIPTPAGNRKPDLIFKQGETAWVLDVQVVSDAGIGSMSDAFDRKTLYYSREKESMLSYCQKIWGISRVEFGAVIVSWRGAVCKRTSVLLQGLGLGNGTLELIAVKAVEGSAEIARTWSRRTTRSVVR